MIRATCFLDPHRRPRNGCMEFIGGPSDGSIVAINGPVEAAYIANAMNLEGRDRHNGEYCFADTPEWAYVWIPLVEPRAK